MLHALSEKGITRLLVEGGARVASSFVAAGLVDEVWLLRGPDLSAPTASPRWTHCRYRLITQSPAFKVRASETLDKDTLTIYERMRKMFTGIVTDIGEIVSLKPTAQGQ